MPGAMSQTTRSNMLDFDKLQTPPDDGAILIEPLPAEWPRLLDENRRRSKQHDIRLAGIPLATVRQLTRRRFTETDIDRPVIAAGHQPSFVHPGVWAKHVVVRHMADKHKAIGVDFVVDNDAPASSTLQVPFVGPDTLLTLQDVPFSHGPMGSAYEGQPPLDDAQLAEMRRDLSQKLGLIWEQSLMASYMEGLASAPKTSDVVEQYWAGRKPIDVRFGADLTETRVSKVFGGPFLAELLLRADAFAASYNEALAEYRHHERIRTANRPLPDLQTDGGKIETALWIYRPMERRRRLWIERQADQLLCYADHVHVGVIGIKELTRDPDRAVAMLCPWLVRPRALTLTLWARLLACDLFVHGIGGAQYDRITDGIFKRFFAYDPPAYTCISATLRMPLPRRAVSLGDGAVARHRVRDFRYNPQRYLSDAPKEWLNEREDLIRDSQRLRAASGSRAGRRQVFLGIRQINARIARWRPEIADELVHRWQQIEQQIQSNHLADSREYFYILQPHKRLEALASRLREIMDR